MIQLVKKNSAFFLPYFLFLLAGGLVLVLWNKVDIHLFINANHTPFFDLFFAYYTNIGLGWLIIPVVLILSFIRLRYVIMALASFLLTFIINDSIKPIVHSPRPIEVFTPLHQSLYLVPGVDMYHWNSFPSGHSAIAFSLFSILALSLSSNMLKFICFIAAFLVAYSRMYLSEHFLIDVYVASIIGVSYSLLVFHWGTKLAWLNKFPSMDKPLINLQKS